MKMVFNDKAPVMVLFCSTVDKFTPGKFAA